MAILFTVFPSCINGDRPSVIGYWLLIVGHWLLIIGHWLLIISHDIAFLIIIPISN